MKLAKTALALLLVGTSLPTSAWAQLLVAPRRANQNRVRHFDFEWRHIDLDIEVTQDLQTPCWARTSSAVAQPIGSESMVTELPAPARSDANAARSDANAARSEEHRDPTTQTSTVPTGRIRLFFYERERAVAERAAAVIERHYRMLIDRFDHVPERVFPYVLYSSYQEFLQTNLFPLQEGVLGVTSPQDLKLTLPYFGDDTLFSEVSAHELAHQLTIQKVHDLAKEAKVRGNPLRSLPLWFIEGIAEFYAKRGIDDETEMLVRDLVVNPAPKKGFAMLDFYDERTFSFLWTYKIGQIRCAFIEETYGVGMLQEILDSSPLLAPGPDDRAAVGGFDKLIEKITGDEAKVVENKFGEWLKKRTFEAYLKKEQDVPALKQLTLAFDDEYVGALDTAPDGQLMMYRTIDTQTGQSLLILLDARNPQVEETVAKDGGPGLESLHPVLSRSFDVRNSELVFIAEARGADVLYRQSIERTVRQLPPDKDDFRKKPRFEVDIDLGSRVRYDLADRGVVAAYAPSFEPGGDRIAFVGLTEKGVRDIFVLTPIGSDGAFSLRRVTHDLYAERSVAWGRDGIVFSSNATESGHFNLFSARIDDTVTASITTLTAEHRDHFDPAVLPDGKIVFVAYDEGSANLFEVRKGYIVRRTDVTTGLFQPCPGPDGTVRALFHYSGRKRLVTLPKESVLLAGITMRPTLKPPRLMPSRSLSAAEPYRALSPENWELANIFALLGVGGGGVFGQAFVSASDKLRNHSLVLDVIAAGRPELISGHLTYINQERRFTYGVGPFHFLRVRFEDRPGTVSGVTFGERFFGGRGILRYPLDRFVYVEGELAVGASDFVDIDFDDDSAEAPDVPLRLQSELSARFGFSTVRYHPGTGPIKGSAFLFELTGGLQPTEAEVYALSRIDAEHFIPLIGRSNLVFRVGGGAAFGNENVRRWFLLTSWYTLRGVDFNDRNFLLGHYYTYATTELQIPLDSFIQLPIFSIVEGIVGLDFGGVSEQPEDLFDRRVLDFVAGFNFGFGPLVLRLHFAWPIDVGAPLPGDGSAVTNVSLGWIYF